MKFDFHKFLDVVKTIAPVVLVAVPGGAAIAPFVPVVIHAIGEAEQIKGATGAEKKAHVLAAVQDSVAIANATGKVSIDPAEVTAAASAGVDAVVGTANIIHGAKAPKA